MGIRRGVCRCVERKDCLRSCSEGAEEFLRFSEHIVGGGEEVFQKACELHAEGIVSKRAASKYSSGRGGDWLKLKCVHEQEFVIGGFTLPSNGSHGVGALLLGYYEGREVDLCGANGHGLYAKDTSSSA